MLATLRGKAVKLLGRIWSALILPFLLAFFSNILLGIALWLPLLWPLFPLLGLLNVLGLGPKFYQWLANNQIIVPNGRMCEEGLCDLQKK